MMNTKYLWIFTLGLSMAVSSCSNDDDLGGETEPPTEEDSNLTGNLTEDRELDPLVEYKITGSFIVKDGATLTIPAGTRLVSETGTDKYIAVEQGGDIIIDGTASNPVVMTSANEQGGDWGGLVICGEATTTAGVDAEAEVGGLIYGGTDDNDDSGSINYLIINYAGAIIQAESQYNGLTLYAVGDETQISNVAVLNGEDDGIEFFGGTVNASNIYLENNQDDSVDWTEGWNGSITNTYVVLNRDDFSTAIEADGANGNPTITDFTAISETGGIALQFKKESGATITGLSLQGFDTSFDYVDEGAFSNVQVEGEDSNPALSYVAEATVDVADFSWVQSGLEAKAYVALSGDLTEDMTLDADTRYLLNDVLTVKSGSTLTIPEGTKITAVDGGASIYIAVEKGAMINVNGTEDNPVVMGSLNGNRGDWGGLVVCGEATTTAGVDAEAEVGGLIYGGTTDDDDSGDITNLVIIGAGAQIQTDSQFNGLTLYAVGSETLVENIAIINGDDDGVEFFGGTVSVNNIYLDNNQDDSVDWTEGWNGTVTNTYIVHTNEDFSTAFEADGVNNNPMFVNVTAVSTVGGTALQFKQQSGATITNLYLEGYDTNIDMVDGGALTNVLIDGAAAVVTGDYTTGTKVDISTWTWIDARL
ncbi:hypothetical protein [Leeuwenhoekiella marinoflava]|nr:hypothetical protein [Leeuwenhoekiella marinoflava]